MLKLKYNFNLLAVKFIRKTKPKKKTNKQQTKQNIKNQPQQKKTSKINWFSMLKLN